MPQDGAVEEHGPVDGERPGEAPARVPVGLVAHVGELVSVVEPDGRVLQVDRTGGPQGRPPDPDRDSLSWVHPDDRHNVTAAFTTLVTDPGARIITVVRIEQDGQEYRHVETTGVDRCDDPLVGGPVFVSRDVEDRVRLEQSAARSLEAQRLVAELGVALLLGGELDPLLGQALTDTRALLEAPCLTLLECDRAGVLHVTLMLGLLQGVANVLAAARQRERREVAVLLVDLYRFRDVNDRFGHAAGDEFVVLCEDVTQARAVLDLCGRVRAMFDAPFRLPGGVASGRGPLDLAALLHAADLAMYRDQRSRPA